MLVLALALVASFLYWATTFAHSYVRVELTAQQVTFPPATSSAITGLPVADAAAMRQYAGQPLGNGDKAQTYANHFIAGHLMQMAGGKPEVRCPG